MTVIDCLLCVPEYVFSAFLCRVYLRGSDELISQMLVDIH